MRVLVMGATGFLGRLLVDDCAARGDELEGWSRRRPRADPPWRHRRVDLADPASLPRRAGPWDAAVLLAAPSVPARFWDPAEGHTTVRIAANALSLLARRSAGARVLVVSSAHVLAPSAAPIDERARPAPQGAYGEAKLEVERLALARAGDLDVRIARVFGSLGPGLPAGLFLPDLLARLADGVRARRAVVRLAGPDALRDLTDGRDVARALGDVLRLDDARGRVFHVGTGRGQRLSRIAAGLASELGFAGRIEFAPGEGPAWIADPTALERKSGWRPTRTLDETLRWTAGAAPRAVAADPELEKGA